ncbi:serine/threonine-protein kinase Nek5-like [Prorops nasuta]|uniref:serine/threonine-protein kinase Nek5-like n=1 Tax=Prorops nasuta TaxID=863751 RepID=UPI0034D01289
MCSMNDYKIESVLGKGTFGTVYLVRRRKDDKPYVIKEQPLTDTNKYVAKMMLNEVQMLQKMRHPNIIAYHCAWKDDEFNYIVMEYAHHGTLKSLIERRKEPLKNEHALYLFAQIILGVHHIHSKNTLHMDLKPENIMLTGRNGDIIKIGDFGMSKNFRREFMSCPAGSYYYMAPEIFMDQLYSFKCDVWSMGVILYEMVTKRLPFPGKSFEEIREMVCHKEPQALPRSVENDTITLISKMLRKKKLNRPRTDQLLLCPFLVRTIATVYLNVGRILNTIDRDPTNFDSRIFTNFLKQRKASES